MWGQFSVQPGKNQKLEFLECHLIKEKSDDTEKEYPIVDQGINQNQDVSTINLQREKWSSKLQRLIILILDLHRLTILNFFVKV